MGDTKRDHEKVQGGQGHTIWPFYFSPLVQVLLRLCFEATENFADNALAGISFYSLEGFPFSNL